MEPCPSWSPSCPSGPRQDSHSGASITVLQGQEAPELLEMRSDVRSQGCCGVRCPEVTAASVDVPWLRGLGS